MASVFKNFTNNDMATTLTLLHEAIPLTGTIVSGTYADENIKNYAHGMFQSVYDYPYLSSSANHIFDVTVGYSNNSDLSGAVNAQNAKKINIYNQMAQVLVGYDVTGSIQDFDADGDIVAGGTKIQECIFITFARLLSKDAIKKGSVSLKLMTGSNPGLRIGTNPLVLADLGGESDFRVNSPAGEYGILYSGSTITSNAARGLIYYQAGIAVLTASIFDGEFGPPASGTGVDTGSVDAVMTGSSISGSADGVRNCWFNLDFNNTVELNSRIFFCRANHSEFNFSSNPTYVSASKIQVKNNSTDAPVAYYTGVGLYSADNELLAVGKLSEPFKKDPSTENVIKARLDF